MSNAIRTPQQAKLISHVEYLLMINNHRKAQAAANLKHKKA